MKNRFLKNVMCFLFSTFLIFIFSCDNGFNSYSNSSTAVSSQKSKTHTVKGYISLSGALPQEVVPVTTESSGAKSAVPAITSDYYYFLEAVKSDGTESYSYGSADSGKFVPASGGTVSFELPLSEGNWNVTTGVKNTSGNTVLSQTLPQTISADETVADLRFVVRPEPSTDGTVVPGDIELTVKTVSSITSVKASCNDSKWKEKTDASGVVDLTFGSSGYTLTVNGLEPDAYDITFTFYNDSDVIRFQTNQTVNVIAGMKTGKWVSGSDADGAVITSTGFEVTSAIMEGFSRTIYYVGDAAGAASENGEGTAYKPYNSLAKAFTAITQTKTSASATKDYIIHITGTQTAATATSGRCYIVPAGIKSLTIMGDSGLESGVPVATINGNNKGTVIEAKSPLILKNVKITGGNASGSDEQGNGGGIYAKGTGIKVTLDSGAYIDSNNAKALGGGLYIYDAELVIKNGAKICSNGITNDETNGGHGGMALYAGNATVTMNGGEISDNNGTTTNSRGAVRIEGTSIFDLNGGKITRNSAKHMAGNIQISGSSFLNINGGEISSGQAGYTGSSYDGNGAGIYSWGPSTINMKAGKISGNKIYAGTSKDGYGAALVLSEGATLNMTGGTIEDNEIMVGQNRYGGSVFVNPGAFFNISGSARIPYGGSAGKNDVFLKRTVSGDTVNQASITVAGTLTGSGTGDVATITPEGWARNSEIIKADTAIVTSDVTKRFKITDEDFKINSNAAFTAGKLSAPIYVAGQGTKNTDYFVCETQGDTSSAAAGTKAKPYATISQALGAISGGGEEVIYIDGIVKGHNEIPETFTTTLCSGLTIKGATALGGSGLPTDILDRESTETALSDDGHVLLINSSVPVTVENIKITGGNSNLGGGAIRIAKSGAIVRLGKGAWLSGNTCGSYTDVSDGGGAVYVGSGARLFLYDKAIIGDKSATEAPNSGGAPNATYCGGAIFNKGETYIGYDGFKADGVTPNPKAVAESYGIIGNWAVYGGAICNNAGTVKIASGSISCNRSNGVQDLSGGAIYNYTSGTVDVCGGTFSKNYASGGGGAICVKSGTSITISGTATFEQNQASKGGALYIEGTCNMTGNAVFKKNKARSNGGAVFVGGTFTMSNGTIGGTSAADANEAVQSNGTTYENGGGVYVYLGKSFTMSGGTISYNKAETGGGVYVMCSTGAGTPTLGTFEMTGGTLSNNTAVGGEGGAVYTRGTFKLSGSASIPYGVGGTQAVGKNDVYLYKLSDGIGQRTITVGAFTSSSPATVATITMQEYKRGTNILSAESSISSSVYNRFAISKDNAGWDRANDNSDPDTKYVYITSPIYVASYGSDTTRVVCEAAPSSGNTGTKTSPYRTIAAALADPDLSVVDNTITIDGTLNAQTISSTTSIAGSATSVTLQGYKASSTATSAAVISGGGTATALSLGKSGLTTIVKDLTITNGNATNGGGINISAGTVKLTDGTMIYENEASSYGGGVYVASGAKLFMYGKALIGDEINPTAAAYKNSSSSMSLANVAANGGGIYNNGGSVYLGYSDAGVASPLTLSSTDGYYGVSRNYATSSGGGIYCNGGTVTVGTGYVSYNASATSGGAFNIAKAGTYNINTGSVIKGNKSEDGGAFAVINTGLKINGGTISNNIAVNRGGAVYASTTTGSFEISDGTFSSNEAQGSTGGGGAVYLLMPTLTLKGGTFTGNKATGASGKGGAIYNAGTLTMSAGTIGSTTTSSQNKVTGTGGQGGAIYQGGTFNVSGSAKVLPGSEKTNDVYLPANGTSAVNKITINSTYSGSGNTGTSKMTITPGLWNRGMQILNGSSLTATNAGYFSVSDTEWLVDSYTPSSTLQGILIADVYVGSSTAVSGSGVSAPPSTASDRRGTKAKPYASITEAVAQCNWDTAATKTKNFKIYVSGMLTATQNIASTIINAKSITITGVQGSSKDGVNRGNPTSGSNRSCLVIDTAVPVTLTKIKLTGGNSNTDYVGGGLSIGSSSNKNGDVTISTDAVITSNKANYGGGICSWGKLTITSGEISSNTAIGGGGIYICDKNLIMSGGEIKGNTATSTGTGNNYGGGGVFFDAQGANAGFAMSGGTISGNKSSSNGAGVLLYAGYFYMSGSAVIGNKNATTTTNSTSGYSNVAGTSNTQPGKGAGIFASDASSGSYKSGGVYIGYTNSSPGSPSSKSAVSSMTGGVFNNWSYGNGAGIYCACANGVTIYKGNIKYNAAFNKDGSGMYLESGSSTISGGEISYNAKANAGGAVYVYNGSLAMSGGLIKKNDADNYGGAIYVSDQTNSAFSMTGGTIGASGESNTVSMKARGGAIYSYKNISISGSAKFIYGGAQGSDDIRLVETAYIDLTGSTLSNHSKSNPIYMSVNVNEKVLGGTYLSNFYRYFAPVQDGYMIDSSGYAYRGCYATASTLAASLNSLPSGSTNAKIVVESGDVSSYISNIRSALQSTNATNITLNLLATSMTSVPSNAFLNCTKLQRVYLPDTVTTIGTSAFSGCTNILEISNSVSWGLPGVKTINENAFKNCSSWNHITFSSVETMYTSAFVGVTNSVDTTCAQGSTYCKIYRQDSDGNYTILVNENYNFYSLNPTTLEADGASKYKFTNMTRH